MSRVCSWVALLLWCCCTQANDEFERLQGVPEPVARVQQIDGAVRASFDAALREYDDYLLHNRHDVASQARRCQFIEQFANTYEYASFSDAVSELGERCLSEAQANFPEHPEITLLTLERSFGKQRLQSAEQVLQASSEHYWTPGQLARLYTLLANTAEDLGDQRSGEFARQALAFDERSDVRVLLATKLAALGRSMDVVNVLTSALDGHDPQDGWYLTTKMQLLAEVAARPQVLSVYASLRERQLEYDALAAARALRQVQAIKEARWEFERLAAAGKQQRLVARERFRFELDFGTGSAALKAYEDWRAIGWQVDPLAINRVALLLHQPWLPWRTRDLLGIATLLLLVAASAAVACVPVAVVHYRGLALRAAGCEPYPQGEWRLRHAWFALFGSLAPSLLALYCAGPLDVLVSVSHWSIDAEPKQLARIALVESLLTLGFLLPLARLGTHHQARWWGTQWSIARSLLVGIAVGIALRAPLLLVATHGKLAHAAPQEPLWQLLSAIREHYGAASALWLLVMFAPVIEEFVFRGVLLKAFTAHLRFGWANAAQAALFAAMHMDLRATPMLFLLALIAGVLARRSDGLLAPMALHATFNLVAGILLLSR